jgi:hypothetical protein
LFLQPNQNKDLRDTVKHPDLKEPSLWRDAEELFEIMENARPNSPLMEADPSSTSFLKVLSLQDSEKMGFAGVEELFRHHAILLIDATRHTSPPAWTKSNIETILQQRITTNVPVHGK